MLTIIKNAVMVYVEMRRARLASMYHSAVGQIGNHIPLFGKYEAASVVWGRLDLVFLNTARLSVDSD